MTIAGQTKISIVYKSENEKEIERTVWPFTIGYFNNGRILVAWCEKQMTIDILKLIKLSH